MASRSGPTTAARRRCWPRSRRAATPVTATFAGADTSTATATITAPAAKFAYLCGFNVSGLGATAATTVSPTITGLASGSTFTLNGAYTFAAGAAVQNTPFNPAPFPTCLAGNGAGTNIVVTVPGAAGNTITDINAWGYTQ